MPLHLPWLFLDDYESREDYGGWMKAVHEDPELVKLMDDFFPKWNVRMKVSLPEGLTNTRTGTKECELNFFTLHGGDGLGDGFTIIVSNSTSPGNYTVTIKLYAQNIPEKIFTPQLTVLFQ